MRRKVIAIDIDDVLAASAEGFAAFSNKQWGANITAKDYTEDWAKLWGVSMPEALKRVTEYYDKEAHSVYEPIKDAHQVLIDLSQRYGLVAATSRQARTRNYTRAWLDKHFPGVFSEVHYVGIWDDVDHNYSEGRLHKTKAELCREIGADYLVDDQPKHCFAAAEAGVKSLLFGDYSWNRDPGPLPKGLVRVKDWSAVRRYFDAQS